MLSLWSIRFIEEQLSKENETTSLSRCAHLRHRTDLGVPSFGG
jgi:hypothetical protein